MKKIMLMMCMLLLIGTASAANWDNNLDYSNNDMTIKITNFFGLGYEIGTATLISHSTPAEVKGVIRGSDRLVMYYEFTGWDLYKNGLGEVEFIDVHTGEKIDRDYYFAIVEKEVTKIEITEQKCDKVLLNASLGCEQVVVGYRDNVEYKAKERLDNNDIPKGNVIIGLVTDVYHRDYVDGIWTIAGKKVNKHSSWTDSLSVDLVSYWSMEEVAGNMLDGVGTNDGVLDGATQGGIGIINDGYEFDGTNDVVDIPDNATLSALPELTISLWINTTTNAAQLYSGLLNKYSAGTVREWYFGLRPSANQIEFAIYDENANAYNIKLKQVTELFNGSYHHVVAVWDGGVDVDSITLYVNGEVLVGTTDTDVGSFVTVQDTGADVTVGEEWGSTYFFNGTMDEIGLWERDLGAAEVTQLWNDGLGLGRPIGDVTVNLVSPEDNFQTKNTNISFSANFVAVDGNFTNTTLNVWYSNGSLFKSNVSGINPTLNSSNLSISDIPILSGYTWNYLTCETDSLGRTICEQADSSRTFDIIPFDVTSQSFSNITYETEQETFSAEVSILTSILSVSSSLNYNGTSYPATSNCTGATCSLRSTIDIPTVSAGLEGENKSFFWEVTVFDEDSDVAVSSNTSSTLQNVSSITFVECGAEQKVVNFSMFDETLQTALAVDFKGTFTYYLGGGTVTKAAVNDNSSIHAIPFCLSENETIKVTSQIELEESGYLTRQYDFVGEEYDKYTTNTTLYMVNDTEATTIIIEVKDQGLIPKGDILVEISRFFPATDTYLLVESRVTDDFGQFVAKLIENDVKYKFEFFSLSGELLKSTGDITIACRATVCVAPFVIEESSDDFDEFTPLEDYAATLSFNNVSNKFVFSWDDRRLEGSIHRLKVDRTSFNGTTSICNITSTSQLGVITCAVGSDDASYNGQAFRRINGDERRIVLLHITVGDDYGIYGLEGLIWVFIILFTLIGVGSFNPPIGALLYMVGITLFGFLGIISFGAGIFFANLVVCALFIWAFRR